MKVCKSSDSFAWQEFANAELEVYWRMSNRQMIERKALRTPTTFNAKLTCKGASSRGLVKDLSDTGICFQFYIDINARLGNEVSIESNEFGHLTGTVRWSRDSKVGIQLFASSNTSAQIASYYRHFREAELACKDASAAAKAALALLGADHSTSGTTTILR